MRIGIITHNYPSSHKERKDAGIFIYDFAHGLANKKNKVFVFSIHSGSSKISDEKVSVTPVLLQSAKKKLGNWSLFSPMSFINAIELFKIRKEVVKFILKNKIDFFLAAWAIPAGIFAQYAHKKTGVPYGVLCLGSDLNKYANYFFLKKPIIDSLKNANIVFANSYSLCKRVKSIANVDCKFIPSVTDFSTDKIKQKKFSNNYFNFLFVGRLEKVKGPDILVQACKYLRKYNKMFKLRMIGEGSMYKLLEKQINQLKLGNNIQLVGMLDRNGVASHMVGSDFLIVPSRNESLPLVILEAARAKLPVISTNVGDCQYFINKYNIGFVVNSNAPEILADGMKKAIEEGKVLKEKYNDGFIKIKKEINQQTSVNKFLSYIKKYDKKN